MTGDAGSAPTLPRPAPAKGPAAFRSISEASVEVGVPPHVLRFWETRFAFIRPTKRAGGRRFYRPQDLEVLRGVRRLLQEEGLTIKGVQKLHKEQGLRRLLEAAGVAEAASLAAEAEAEAEARPPLAPLPEPPSIGTGLSSAAPLNGAPPEDERDDRTGDLFGGPAAGLAPAADAPDPRPPPAAEDPNPDIEVVASTDVPDRRVLDADARRRLSSVLRDLEATKAAIDDLLAAGE